MIKAVIETETEVPEALRDHYEQRDGKFYLQVDGVKTQADIDKQLVANRAERTEHTATRQKLKEAEDKLAAFGSLSPEDVKDKLTTLASLEAAGSNPAAEEIRRIAETLANAKAVQRTQELTRSAANLKLERDAATAKSADLLNKINIRQIDDAVREAATTAHVLPDAVDTLTKLARSEFKVDGDTVLSGDGRSPADWIENFKTTSPFLWPVSKGAGAHSTSGFGNSPLPVGADNPFSNEGWNLTRQSEVLLTNPSRAHQLAEIVGTKVGGPRPARAA
jgi:hypothetical protein